MAIDKNETDASRHITNYMKVVYPDKPSDDPTKRAHKAVLRKLTKFVIDQQIQSIDNDVMTEFKEYCEKDLNNSPRTIANNKKPLTDFITWGQSNGAIGQSIEFDLCVGDEDDLIDLFDKNKWKLLDKVIIEWEKGKGIIDPSGETSYNRMVLHTYVQFMNEARPLSSEVARALRWRDVIYGELNTVEDVKYNDRSVVSQKPAHRILERWRNQTHHHNDHDRIFRYTNTEKVDFLIEVQTLTLNLKDNIDAIVLNMNRREKKYLDYDKAHDMARELCAAVSTIIFNQGPVKSVP